MTGPDKFTPDEWRLLTKAGMLVGHSIIICDKPRRARKEQRALGKAFERTAANYPGNELIAAVMPEAKRMAQRRIDARTLFMEREIVTEGFMEELGAVGKILTKAEKKEAREFKLWLLNLGDWTDSGSTHGRRTERSGAPPYPATGFFGDAVFVFRLFRTTGAGPGISVTVPPAARIFSRACALKWWADTFNDLAIVPFPRIFTSSQMPLASPTARRLSGETSLPAVNRSSKSSTLTSFTIRPWRL